ncbi:hypothetical protein SH528x_004185 [Novipirellula sp. SH528]
MIPDLTLIPFLDETSGTALRGELATEGYVRDAMRSDDNQEFRTIVEVVS